MLTPQAVKIPLSVLVVIYVQPAQPRWDDVPVLLLERAGSGGFWQSVTGSLDTLDEPFEQAAAREVVEETGLDVQAPGCTLQDWRLENVYEIYPQWRWRYAPQVTHNKERVFGLALPSQLPVRMSAEHTAYEWLPAAQAMQRCFSPSNTEAISWLPRLGLCAA